MTDSQTDSQTPMRRMTQNRWTLLALAIFTLCLITLFHQMAGQDPREIIVINGPEAIEFGTDGFEIMSLNDLRFVTALLSRNARTLRTEPDELFDLEYCYPAQNALAHGEALISPSILGIAPSLLLDDPVFTFNFVLFLSTLIAAFSMFFAIREWTGVPAAGIAAGILFGFHATRMRDPVHFFVWDNAWTLFALVFAMRLFRQPRWRDAIGLAICCAMQIGGSLYPLLAAVLFALPYLAWLLLTYGYKQLRPAMWGLVVVCALSMAYFALGPFLEAREMGEVTERADYIFMPSLLFWLEPGQWFFPGLIMLVLTVLGLLSRKGVDRDQIQGDPRWAFLMAGALCLILAAAGHSPPEAWASWDMPENPILPVIHLPEIWRGLAEFIPGLDIVRSPGALISGVHMAMVIFAGFGAAALLRGRRPPVQTILIILIIAAAYLDTLRPEMVGLEPRQQYAVVPMKPPTETLEFYEQLESNGNQGPLYEITFPRTWLHPRLTLPLIASEYHRRPTSVCYNSFVAATDPSLRDRIPQRQALRELKRMGFTTIIVHHPPLDQESRVLRAKLRRFAAKTRNRYIEEVGSSPSMTAFAIRLGSIDTLRSQREESF